MSEDEVITKLYGLLHINTYIDLCEQIELSVKIPKITLKKWKDNCNSLLDLYQQEKEKNKELENKINRISHIIDTNPYTAYTLYGDILYDDQAIRDIIEDTHKFKGELF